jgi:acrylyl-CoA reductase (NADPH)
MADETFKALVLEQRDEQITSEIRDVRREELPEGDTLVRVAYSALNYKDGLALSGRNKVVRSYPMVPGIDFSGTVEETTSSDFAPGDRVVLTGWGVGERHWGGYAQFARAKSAWLVPLPENIDLKYAMGLGTAGVTAMLCILALEEHGLTPEKGEVLVTGASGGVGGMAVTLLAALGYSVTASTGRADAHEYLQYLGAKTIIDRNELTALGGPMGSARWAGAVDTVGGETLAGVLRTLAYGASVAACGNAGGAAVNTTVLPFILRGVNLLGIDSLPTPIERRRIVWERLARLMSAEKLDRMMTVVRLDETPALAQQILAGQTRGRIVVDVTA